MAKLWLLANVDCHHFGFFKIAALKIDRLVKVQTSARLHSLAILDVIEESLTQFRADYPSASPSSPNGPKSAVAGATVLGTSRHQAAPQSNFRMFRRLRKRIHGGWMRGNATVLVPSPRVADAWPFRAPERQPAPFLGDDGASCRMARGWGEVVEVFHPSFVPRRQNKPTNLSIFVYRLPSIRLPGEITYA
jgi:hypothetical protein